jgi:hypothetical protein
LFVFLQVVEGSVAGLEVSQGEGLVRLSSSFNSSLADAQAGLQVMTESDAHVTLHVSSQ